MGSLFADSEQFMLIEHIDGQVEQIQNRDGINDEQWRQYQKVTRGCKDVERRC